MFSTKLKNHIIKLHQKKYRKLYGEFVVEGFKSIDEALNKNAEVKFIVIEENFSKTDKGAHIAKKADDKDIEIHTCNESDAGKIKSTVTYPGVSAVITQKIFSLKDLKNKNPIVALDKISDPGNLGTIIRTADWFGYNNVLLSVDSVDPYNEKVVRSTMGSIFNTKLYISDNISKSIDSLKDDGYDIILLDTKGKDIDNLTMPKKAVYLFGSESHGISPELEKIADKRYTIKGSGGAESLNVSVSAGIVLSKIK